MKTFSRLIGIIGVVVIVAVLLITGPVAIAQNIEDPAYSYSLNGVAAASTAGSSVGTRAFACTSVQAWASSGTASTDIYVQQSIDKLHWKTVWTISNPSATLGASEIYTGPSAPYTRAYVASNYASGTVYAIIGKTGSCDPQAGWKAQASLPSSGTEITDGSMFIPAWAACAATTPSATLVATRAAANDYNLTRTAGGAETYSISCSLGSWLKRTTTSAGYKITGLKVVHQITVAALTSNSAPTVKTITYANNTANALAAFGGTITATMPTATQTNPYVTTIGLGTPAYFNTADSDLTIDWTAVMQNTGVYAVQGIIVTYTKTNP